MTRWGWFWLSWILVFVVGEAIALFNPGEHDTLSAHVWRWMGAGWSWQRYSVILFFAWLTYHFVIEGLHWKTS